MFASSSAVCFLFSPFTIQIIDMSHFLCCDFEVYIYFYIYFHILFEKGVREVNNEEKICAH